jgi:hypothetical protein
MRLDGHDPGFVYEPDLYLLSCNILFLCDLRKARVRMPPIRKRIAGLIQKLLFWDLSKNRFFISNY